MHILVRFALAGIDAEPWRNGGGVTRQVAAGRLFPEPATCVPGEPWDWRISVAEISRDGPFSTFPGVDRRAVLIDGALELYGEGGGEVLDFARPGEVRGFAGETVCTAQLRGGHARLLNVMAQRARSRANVRVQRTYARIDAGGPGCLFVAAGAFRVEIDEGRTHPIDLLADQGLHWQAISTGATVRRLTTTGLLVHVDFVAVCENGP